MTTVETLQALRTCYAEQKRLQARLVGELPAVPRRAVYQPPLVPDGLASLLDLEGERMTPFQVARHLYSYIKENKLLDRKNKHVIHPNKKLRRALELEKGDELDLFNLQVYLHDLYD